LAEEGVVRQDELALAISNAVVRELASTTGREPTQAKTTLGDNAVFVVLQDTLTRGERTLVGAGESEAVLDLRRLSRDDRNRSRNGQAGHGLGALKRGGR
jgi:uncharacterized protein YbcI